MLTVVAILVLLILVLMVLKAFTGGAEATASAVSSATDSLDRMNRRMFSEGTLRRFRRRAIIFWLAVLALILAFALPAASQSDPDALSWGVPGGVDHAERALETWQNAEELGLLIGSERACGLSYDQQALGLMVTAMADGVQFVPLVEAMAAGAAEDVEQMSPALRAAHCSTVEQSARAFGFLTD